MNSPPGSSVQLREREEKIEHKPDNTIEHLTPGPPLLDRVQDKLEDIDSLNALLTPQTKKSTNDTLLEAIVSTKEEDLKNDIGEEEKEALDQEEYEESEQLEMEEAIGNVTDPFVAKPPKFKMPRITWITLAVLPILSFSLLFICLGFDLLGGSPYGLDQVL
jgi:hypothetical protein